jgi:hypothetical protein
MSEPLQRTTMITLEEILNRIEELIDDPAHWHNDVENQKKELEDMIKEYAYGSGGCTNQKVQVIHG